MHVYRPGGRESGIAAYDESLEASFPGLEVLEGNPKQSGREDFASPDGAFSAGVWECTKGRFRITYPMDEIATLLKGKLVITDDNGRKTTLQAGDSFFVARGETLTWNIVEPVRKSYFLYMPPAKAAKAAVD